MKILSKFKLNLPTSIYFRVLYWLTVTWLHAWSVSCSCSTLNQMNATLHIFPSLTCLSFSQKTRWCCLESRYVFKVSVYFTFIRNLLNPTRNDLFLSVAFVFVTGWLFLSKHNDWHVNKSTKRIQGWCECSTTNHDVRSPTYHG